ncbi:response regulator [Desulfosarcina sp. OttesenSCG-928-B08]|nr:response regulator [Desulfosarcina sp. OttesenSCG-928-B08]
MNPPYTDHAPHRQTVLLVDDEAVVLEVGKAILQRFGHPVITAASGEEAITRFSANQDAIFCVVLDLIMPGIGGLATFNRLKAIRPDLPIIVSSGMPADQILHQFGSTPPAAVIQKPYQIAELSGKIQALMKTRAPKIEQAV